LETEQLTRHRGDGGTVIRQRDDRLSKAAETPFGLPPHTSATKPRSQAPTGNMGVGGELGQPRRRRGLSRFPRSGCRARVQAPRPAGRPAPSSIWKPEESARFRLAVVLNQFGIRSKRAHRHSGLLITDVLQTSPFPDRKLATSPLQPPLTGPCRGGTRESSTPALGQSCPARPTDDVRALSPPILESGQAFSLAPSTRI